MTKELINHLNNFSYVLYRMECDPDSKEKINRMLTICDLMEEQLSKLKVDLKYKIESANEER